jgi:hypothetical protein
MRFHQKEAKEEVILSVFDVCVCVFWLLPLCDIGPSLAVPVHVI